MTDRVLGVPARSALLVLMANGGSMTNVEMKAWLTSGIEKKERILLNDQGLIASDTDHRPHLHRLTDDGWAWCARELSAGGPPPRSGSMGGALYAVLLGLAGHLRRSGSDLGELFADPGSARDGARSAPDTVTGAAALTAPGDGRAGPTDDSDDPTAVERAIRDRYRDLAEFPNDWVRLADLRPALDGLDRAAVDQTLLAMNRRPDTNLAPEPVQSMLTERDHRAAVEVGGRATHLLAVDLDG